MNLSKLSTLTAREIQALHLALPTMSLKDKMELFDDLEIREKRASLAAAEHSMLGFARAVYPNFKEGPHHRKLAKIFTDVIEGRKKRVIINIAPRMGKLLADDTPVLTTQGWKTHGALVVGDFVFHPAGRPVEVLGVSAKHAADVCVEFSNGETLYCHENHEWTLWNVARKCYETLETGEFLRPQKDSAARTAAETYLLPGVSPL